MENEPSHAQQTSTNLKAPQTKRLDSGLSGLPVSSPRPRLEAGPLSMRIDLYLGVRPDPVARPGVRRFSFRHRPALPRVASPRYNLALGAVATASNSASSGYGPGGANNGDRMSLKLDQWRWLERLRSTVSGLAANRFRISEDDSTRSMFSRCKTTGRTPRNQPRR